MCSIKLGNAPLFVFPTPCCALRMHHRHRAYGRLRILGAVLLPSFGPDEYLEGSEFRPRPWDFDDPASSTTSTPKLPSTSPAEDTKETKGKQSAKEQSPTSPLVVSPLPAINSGPSMLESQKSVPITVVA